MMGEVVGIARWIMLDVFILSICLYDLASILSIVNASLMTKLRAYICFSVQLV